jgi:hypothetical protein
MERRLLVILVAALPPVKLFLFDFHESFGMAHKGVTGW